MTFKNSLKAIVAGLIVANLAGCKGMDMARLSQAGAVAMQGLTVTNDQLIGAVKQSVAQMDAQNKVAPATSAYTQRLNNLTRGLTSTGTVPLNFKVYETNEINAFACPDGSVRVYSGIMDLMTDDELLGIIGHEIGHVAMEHSLNAYKQQYMNASALMALGSTNSTVAAITDSQILSGLLQKGLSAKFSREQENQADDFGYDFLKGAGRNPYAMVMAFEKMQKLENSQNVGESTYFQKMFSSHPETTERINRMLQKCKKDGFTRPTATTSTNKTNAKSPAKTTTKK